MMGSQMPVGVPSGWERIAAWRFDGATGRGIARAALFADLHFCRVPVACWHTPSGYDWRHQVLTNVQHTPGPWRVEVGTTLVWGEYLIAEDGSIETFGTPVACAYDAPSSWGRTISDDEKEANARLIAAAPELLAALKWALSKLNLDPCEWSDEDDANAHEAARAAIATAKGVAE